MSREYVFEGIEIDIPLCSRVWGVSTCVAALSTRWPRKCWNLRLDCAVPSAYNPTNILTIRLCRDGPIPNGQVWFPVLGNVRASSGTVNIAGSDPDSSGLGRQATLSFEAGDFAYHERGIDPYQAERVSGAAQFSGVGYKPGDQGLFLTKLKARWPYYADSPVRYIKGYLENGTLSDVTTVHYFLKEWAGPNDGRHSFEARGVTDFANKKTALAPKASPGRLTLDLTNVATTFDVTPTGAGASYPASGRVCIGSEVMNYTLSGDTFTVTRGVRGTTAASHSQGDTVQWVLSYTNAALYDVVHDLVENYTETPADYLSTTVKNLNIAEVDRWGVSIRLQTDIVTPTAVDKLLGELGDLGCTVYEDQVGRRLLLKMNRPLDTDVARLVTDRSAKRITQEDNDDRRLTQILFCYKRFDVTKSLTDENNFAVRLLTVDTDILARHGGNVRSRTIYTRWLDQGDESTVAVASIRLLDRFKRAPKTVTIRLDAREKDLALVDVLRVESEELADGDGLVVPRYVQVVERSEPIAYHEIEAICEAFQFDGRYGYIAPDTVTNTYDIATTAEKAAYAFIAADATGFADGTDPYKVI